MEKTRLSPTQMHKTLLATAKELMSERFETHSPQVTGFQKPVQEPAATLSQQRKVFYR